VLEFSLAEARQLALGAQGFGAPRKGGSLATLRKLSGRLNAFQIDSVNVLVRAHYMPAFSRLGPYPMKALDTLAYDKRELFEYWGHAACFLPMANYPLFRFRMDGRREADYWGRRTADAKKFMNAVYKFVADNGPVGAGSITLGKKKTGNWWGWSDAKVAVEALFRSGRLAVAGRRNFERLYDLTERVIPASALDAPVPDPAEAKKQLLVIAAKAHGIGTARDIAGYFHIDNWWDRAGIEGKRAGAELPKLVKELEEDGRLLRVSVEGWDKPAYVVPRTKVPSGISVRALLSPFDPLMWERKPTQRLFGFDYKIEIYVPAPKRLYGYYCLPFLVGDTFAGRIDLKADRKGSALLVPGAFSEPGTDPKLVASELADELTLMASWLELDRITVGEKGDLARPLARALR
jgi:uncharacterized protein YcaQ